MRALISVSDKTGIVEFAKELHALGTDIISTGGTAKALRDAGLPVIGISEVTGFPECLDGRVKTLHPKIHAGLLAMRSNEEHMKQVKELGVELIDIVVVNLYPFKKTVQNPDSTHEEIIENIDIGGPTMIRAAAKNYQDVSVIVDPADYDLVLSELKEKGKVSQDTKFYLCGKVFSHTAQYDAMIADYMHRRRLTEKVDERIAEPKFPKNLTLTYEKVQDMRYGENPHQAAAFYKEIGDLRGYLPEAVQLHGKELSFNNINDTHGALELLKEFDEPAVVACKHSNPCGVGVGNDLFEAWTKAYTSDPVSVFGGIICCNREVGADVAKEISKIFIEIVLAPSFTEEALQILSKKKNIRLLKLQNLEVRHEGALDTKKVGGGLLVQDTDGVLLPEDQELTVVTERKPTESEMKDLLFAWKIVKYVKSNGIAIAKNGQSVGAGPGQVNRIWPTKQAIEHGVEALGAEALQGAALASDAFFPFDDCVREAHKAGITCIIQPGGSLRDQDSIDYCNEHGIAMVFTHMRHFRH